MHEKDVAAIGLALSPDSLNVLKFSKRESRKRL